METDRSARLTEAAKDRARALGFGLVGVCDAAPPETLAALDAWLEAGFEGPMGYMRSSRELRASLDSVLPGARTVLAVGLNYAHEDDWKPGAPRIAAYARGRDYHKILRGRLARIGRWLEAEAPGERCRPVADSAPVMEREYARRAGLGWFGKNTCLIDSRTGSQFVVGLLLTTIELVPDRPVEGGCGTCRLCVDACPTGAIVTLKDRWAVDGRRCVSALTIEERGEVPEELRPGVGEWTFWCDVCQDVCPFNQRRESQPQRAVPTWRSGSGHRWRLWPRSERMSGTP
jgi:epoxyqueuosine reductase